MPDPAYRILTAQFQSFAVPDGTYTVSIGVEPPTEAEVLHALVRAFDNSIRCGVCAQTLFEGDAARHVDFNYAARIHLCNPYAVKERQDELD